MDGLGVIFHSRSFDRVTGGLSIALAAAALGRDVRLLFTYWAIEYIKKGGREEIYLDEEAKRYSGSITKGLERGHLRQISSLISEARSLGTKIYACANSMGVLNVARDELVPEVDKVMGLTAFLTETLGYQVLFI